MRKRRWLALLAALALCLTGCGAASNAPSAQTVGAEVAMPTQRGAELNGEQVLRQSIFALRSGYDVLRNGEDVCYSPVSVYFALALAATGAEGQTQKELLDVLDVSDAETLSRDMKALFERLYQTEETCTVLPANSLWLDQGIEVYDTFTDNAARNFYAHTFTLDFSDPQAGGAMTKWISEQTKGLLAPQIKLSDNDTAVLLNTLYFKANWTDAFAKENTKAAPFTRSDGTEIECDFMHSMRAGEYMEIGGTQIAALPLYGGYKMVFLLPDEEMGIQGLLEQYSADRLLSMKPPPPDSAVNYNSADTLLPEASGMYNGLPVWFCQVEWSVPKFHTSSELSLVEMLERLGVRSAFSDLNADFGGICDVSRLPNEMLYISKVQHGTDISIDEEGVEAAAYTEINMVTGADMPPEQIVEMNLNRPFLYGIQNSDGVFLFVGRCDNPSAE